MSAKALTFFPFCTDVKHAAVTHLATDQQPPVGAAKAAVSHSRSHQWPTEQSESTHHPAGGQAASICGSINYQGRGFAQAAGQEWAKTIEFIKTTRGNPTIFGPLPSIACSTAQTVPEANNKSNNKPDVGVDIGPLEIELLNMLLRIPEMAGAAERLWPSLVAKSTSKTVQLEHN